MKIYNSLHTVVREHTDFVQKWIEFFYRNYSLEVKKKIESGVCLDAGCGGTVKGVKLINKFDPAKVFACDINEDHSPLYLEENIADFICCDITALVFEDNYFDFVLCNGVVHHTQDPCKAISELCRVLKPGGVIHVSVYCFKNSMFHYLVLFLRMLAKLIPFRFSKLLSGRNFLLNVLLDHAYVPYEFVYTKKEFMNNLHQAGISVDYILNVSDSHKNRGLTKILARNERLLFGDGAILSFIGHKNTVC